MRHFFRHSPSLVFIIAAIAAFAAVAMLLWNWLMPAIFGLPLLSYWQSVGILVLTRLLFGGIGHRGHFGNDFHHNHKLREKWMNMSEEERKTLMGAFWRGREAPNE
jgi:hypothetical protein